jgi:hypothetical protein
VLLLRAEQTNALQPKGTTRQRRFALTGKVVFVTYLKICSGWIENLKALRGEIHPAGFCKGLTLSQALELLQLWRRNIREAQGKQNLEEFQAKTQRSRKGYLRLCVIFASLLETS